MYRKRMIVVLAGLEEKTCSLDDVVVVFSKDQWEHDNRLLIANVRLEENAQSRYLN